MNEPEALSVPSVEAPAEREAPREKSLGIARTIGLILGAHMILLPLGLPAYFLEKLLPRFTGSFQAIAMLGTAAFVAWKLPGDTWQAKVPLHGSSRRLTLGALGVWAALLCLELAFLFGLDRMNVSASRNDLPASLGGLFLIALAAPLLEELWFRRIGLLWLGQVITPRRAVIFTAAGFALSHPPIQYVGTFAFGLILAWLAQRTGSLRLPLLLHVLNNALAGSLFCFAPKHLQDAKAPWALIVALAVVGLAAGIPLLRQLKGALDKEHPVQDLPRSA